ncbi:hypothetical protein V8G54_021579, partial [Vigna mungo]
KLPNGSEEQVKLEESVFLPSMTTRSFLVGDGNQVIRRANDVDSFSGITGSEEYRLHREGNKVKDKSVLFGVPSFSNIGSSNDAKKMKVNVGNRRSMRLCPTSNVLSGKHIHTQLESIGSVSQLPGSCDQRCSFPFNCLSFIKHSIALTRSGNWVKARKWAAVPGSQATYLGNPVPWGTLPTILVIEFLAISFVEHQRTMEKDPEKKKYLGGAFDPLG